MDSKGNAALLKSTQVTAWNINSGGWIPILFGSLILFGCAIAYVIAVARGNVDPILPLISDAAGSPPQNGLFGTFVCFGGMCGVVFMVQRYMIVLEKNREKSSIVTAVNKLSLYVGIGSMLGITLITGYPINFYRNRDVWLMDVGLPHMIGGVMLFALGLLYIALQCVLTLFLKSKKNNSLFIRVLLLFICTAAFVYHMIIVPENFRGVSHMYYQNTTDLDINYTGLLPYPPTLGSSLKLPIDTSGTYVTSAITEWIFVIFFCCFFFTFFKEGQEYSLQFIIETNAKEVVEDFNPDIRKVSIAQGQNGSQIEKPAPEMKKVLRRDSTCQTITEALTSSIPNKKQFVDPVKLQMEKTISNAEIDAKLRKLLDTDDSKADGKKEKKSVGVDSGMQVDINGKELEATTETHEDKCKRDSGDV